MKKSGPDKSFLRLVEIMARLRGKNGCPWDREQDPESLMQWTLEETYELFDAIEGGTHSDVCEELGDLLLQVVFYARIYEEMRKFDIAEVIDGICEKLVRRHPHVFGGIKVSGSGEVLKNWALIKLKEKPHRKKSVLDGVPRKMPALHEAFRLTEKASRVGFDWRRFREIEEKLMEELGELRLGMRKKDRRNIEHEVGDILFVAANIARFLEVNPEMALRKANSRFSSRFRFIEEELRKTGRTPDESSLEEMDKLWEKSKRVLEVRKQKT